MANPEHLRERVLLRASDANIDFNDLRRLLTELHFTERIKGSHHIFTRPGVEEIINIQPKGNTAKAYQVKQVRNIILKYRMEL
ncbi:MAG: type II toxin-antitoxin system HicA family toxin [Pyrinomonadaceae bacterium]